MERDEVRWDKVEAVRKRIAEGYYDRPVVIRLGVGNLLQALTSECRRGSVDGDDQPTDTEQRHG